jgi:hypothetical protein
MVAKRKASLYRATEKPSSHWIKIKNRNYPGGGGPQRNFLSSAQGRTLRARIRTSARYIPWNRPGDRPAVIDEDPAGRPVSSGFIAGIGKPLHNRRHTADACEYHTHTCVGDIHCHRDGHTIARHWTPRANWRRSDTPQRMRLSPDRMAKEFPIPIWLVSKPTALTGLLKLTVRGADRRPNSSESRNGVGYRHLHRS